MKRRAFLKILPAMAALGTWIKPRPSINPAWINAPYEAYFAFGQGTFDALKTSVDEVIRNDIRSAYHGISFGIDPHPLRVKL